MEHTNKVIIQVLTYEFSDYPRNSWHYDREYELIEKALKLNKETVKREEKCACSIPEVYKDYIPTDCCRKCNKVI